MRLNRHVTTQRYIDKLNAAGIVVEVTGKGRNRLYRAEGILKVPSPKFKRVAFPSVQFWCKQVGNNITITLDFLFFSSECTWIDQFITHIHNVQRLIKTISL